MPAESPSSPVAFHFVSQWRVQGTCGEVADIIDDPLALVEWWPSVYLSAVEVAPPQPNGLGRRVAFVTQGWLPYTLSWDITVVERRYPSMAALVAHGDLEGSGVWQFEQDGADVRVTFDWRVALQKPGLRQMAPFLRPVFEANHRWAMRQGEASLVLELARRRAASDAARAAVAPPPGPVTYAGVAVVAGAAVVGGTLFYLMAKARQRARRRRRERLTARSDS